MKVIYHIIRRLLGGGPARYRNGNPISSGKRSVSSTNPASVAETNVSPPDRVRYSGDVPPRRRGRIRSYAEEEANHDRWVEGLSPWTVACAARDLAPPSRSRWWPRQRERPPTAYEIWRVERHAALMRRMESTEER